MKQTYILTSLLCLATLLMPGCTSPIGSGDDPSSSTLAINFGTPQADTRAAVNSSADMGEFSVWGGYDGNASNVFNQVTVHSPGWTYDGGTRYWISGKTYNFYAMHPAGLNASVDDSGTITVNNFDCSKTGNEAVDLMTATATGLKGSEAPTVGLKFGHELAQVNFQAKTQGSKVTITSFKINGVSYAGDFSQQPSSESAQWTPKKVTNAGDGIFSVTNIMIENTTDLLSNILILPQQLETGKQQLAINFRYDGETTDRTQTIDLCIENSITEWTASQSYTYTLDLRTASLILTVTIQDWMKENADVTWDPSK
jgi:hypothetical protein